MNPEGIKITTEYRGLPCTVSVRRKGKGRVPDQPRPVTVRLEIVVPPSTVPDTSYWQTYVARDVQKRTNTMALDELLDVCEEMETCLDNVTHPEAKQNVLAKYRKIRARFK